MTNGFFRSYKTSQKTACIILFFTLYFKFISSDLHPSSLPSISTPLTIHVKPFQSISLSPLCFLIFNLLGKFSVQLETNFFSCHRFYFDQTCYFAHISCTVYIKITYRYSYLCSFILRNFFICIHMSPLLKYYQIVRRPVLTRWMFELYCVWWHTLQMRCQSTTSIKCKIIFIPKLCVVHLNSRYCILCSIYVQRDFVWSLHSLFIK